MTIFYTYITNENDIKVYKEFLLLNEKIYFGGGERKRL